MLDLISLNGPRVCLITYNNLCFFEFGIAVEVFGLPRPEFGSDWYQFEVISAEGAELNGLGGVKLQIDQSIDALDTADIIVLPGWREPYVDVPERLIKSLRMAYERGARIVAICGGAYVLAATGLLKGRRATTHWRFLHHFVKEFPDVDLDDAPLFCEESRLYTSAGSAAGIDLCLHVVQQDYGLDKANDVARRLVVSPLRAGAQRQEISLPMLPQNKHQRLPIILEKLKANLEAPLTIEQIASQAGFSPRTFIRQFQKITGSTFGNWIKAQRMDRAKSLLAETYLSVELIAEACGYASSSSLRRLFSAEEGRSPLSYRKNKNRGTG